MTYMSRVLLPARKRSNADGAGLPCVSAPTNG